MWTMKLTLAWCLCMLVLAAPCCCEPLNGPESISRPARPKSFASPDDLRLYLDQLGQYFAVVGRPRFGKRTAASRPVSREVVPSYQLAQQPSQADSSEMFDIIQYYQPQQQE